MSEPDENNTWITEGLQPEFATFLPIGSREAKAARTTSITGIEVKTIFKLYSQGTQTGRDNWMYDFDRGKLADKAKSMVEVYNAELSRWIRAGCSKDIDSFVIGDETKIKWSSRLKECFTRKIEVVFDTSPIRNSLYRPFSHQYLYFDNVMTHRQGMLPIVFPTPVTETENIVICLTVLGSEKPFMALATKIIPDLHLVGAGAGAQCFPFYTYTEDGSNRRENITDWALQQFQSKYGPEVTKWDIFHYVYGMLHHPEYRERYKENLKRDLPHIPLLLRCEAFETCVQIGKQLMDIHLNKERWIEPGSDRDVLCARLLANIQPCQDFQRSNPPNGGIEQAGTLNLSKNQVS